MYVISYLRGIYRYTYTTHMIGVIITFVLLPLLLMLTSIPYLIIVVHQYRSSDGIPNHDDYERDDGEH